MTSAKLIHIYVKKIIATRQFYWRGKLKKTEKKTSNVERPYFNGQMGIERSMMTIVAKSPGNVNSESKQLSPAGVFSQQTWRCHQENAKYL